MLLDPNKQKGCASGGYVKRKSGKGSGQESEDPDNPSEGLYYPDGSLIRDSNSYAGFGDKSSFKGYYRVLAFREAESVEFCRGNFATGIRGIIDPQDPDNPYGPKSKEELQAAKLALSPKGAGGSIVMGASTAASDALMDGLDMSAISKQTDHDVGGFSYRTTLENQNLEAGACLYEKGRAGPLSSIFMIRDAATVTHLEVPHNEKALLYDRAVDQLKEWCKGVDTKSVTSLAHQTNTWGLSSNNWFAEDKMKKFKKLVDLRFQDTVHFRHRSDVCMGL